MFPHISHVPSTGYDGQFYYRFAFNPFNWNPTAYGITVDHNYRYTRIGYSLVAYDHLARRPRPAAAHRPRRGQPDLRRGHGLPRGAVRPRVRAARALGAAVRRLLRPGDQRRPGHLRAAGRRLHARRAARLPALPLRAGGSAGRLRRLHQRADPGARGRGRDRAALPVLAEAGQARQARPDLGAPRRSVRAAPGPRRSW